MPLDADDEIAFPLRPSEYSVSTAFYRDGEESTARAIVGWSRAGVALVVDVDRGEIVPARDLPGYKKIGLGDPWQRWISWEGAIPIAVTPADGWRFRSWEEDGDTPRDEPVICWVTLRGGATHAVVNGRSGPTEARSGELYHESGTHRPTA